MAMDYPDRDRCAQIIADLNSLARMAALEGARETRRTAALLAGEYRFRRDAPKGEVELRNELEAVCTTLRLCKARYGLTPDWACPEGDLPPVLIPGGVLIGLIDRLLQERLPKGLPFFLRVEARAEEETLLLSVEDGPGALPEKPPAAVEADEARSDESVAAYAVDGGERRLYVLRIPV
jgi:hypothetical protein